MGIVATKLRLQNKVWWTENDKDAKRYVWSCHGCQLVGQPTSPEPSFDAHCTSAWQMAGLAFRHFGPMPHGEYLLVVVDYYTR